MIHHRVLLEKFLCLISFVHMTILQCLVSTRYASLGHHVVTVVLCVLADSCALFLSAVAFQKPYEHLSQDETKRTVLGYLAYLKDNTNLISNPGVRVSLRPVYILTLLPHFP